MWRTVSFERVYEQVLLTVVSNSFYITFLLLDIFVVCSYINHTLRRKDIHLKYFIFNWSVTYPLPS